MKSRKVQGGTRGAFVEEFANEAELGASRGELGTVYKVTKQLCGKNSNPNLPVKDKHGNNISTKREQTVGGTLS